MTNFRAARWPGDTDCRANPDETITLDGITYRRHPNGGGFVADTATVEPSAFVGLFARISGSAWISGNARIYDDAQISQ